MSIRLGKLIGRSPQHLIIQSPRHFTWSLKNIPKIGSTVKMLQPASESTEKQIVNVGRLSDTFGPVSRPYFSVKTYKHVSLDEFEEEIGNQFYCETQNQKYRSRRQQSRRTRHPTRRSSRSKRRRHN